MANEAGQGCVDRAALYTADTIVSQGAPASQGGSCNKLEVYVQAVSEDTAAYFAFFTASGNDLTTVAGTRTNVTIPLTNPAACVSLSAPGDFTAFSVNSGNYLGCFVTGAQDVSTSTGSGYWQLPLDNTDASSTTFNNDADGLDALSADIVAAGGISIPVVHHHRRRH